MSSDVVSVPMRPRTRNLLFAVAIFALVGPLVGGAVMVALIFGAERRFDPAMGQMLGLIVWFSYLSGGPKALVTGIGTALLARWRGGTSFWHPMLVVAAIYVALSMALVAKALSNGSASERPLRHLELPSPVLSLIAAAICWLIVRPLLRPAER